MPVLTTVGWGDNQETYQSFATRRSTDLATGASYLVKEGDEGKTIDVVATATNEQGLTASSTSLATLAVIDAAPTVIARVIADAKQEGVTLAGLATVVLVDIPLSYQ